MSETADRAPDASKPCTFCGSPGVERSVIGNPLCDSCAADFIEWATGGGR